MGEYLTRKAETIDLLSRPNHAPVMPDALNILIIDEDRDCADALEMLLEDMPGVSGITTASTTIAALATLDDSRLDTLPNIIFIDPQTRVDRVASTQATLRALRRRMPDAAIVLLNVYPGSISRSLRGLVDHSLRKDTSYRELRELIETIAAPGDGLAAIPAAG